MAQKKADLRWVALGGVQLANLLAAVDATAVGIALPDIARHFALTASDAGWIITVYYVANLVLMPISGRLADSYGRRRVFLLGFILFILASTLCGFAPSLGWLLAARVLQAAGAACLLANGSAISAELFEGPARGIALGLNSTVTASGYALGYVMGGVITGAIGWRPVFFVEIPIALIALLVTVLALPALRPGRRVPIPLVNFALMTLGLGLVLHALRAAGVAGRIDAVIGAELAGGLAVLVVFLVLERRVSNPILPLHLFAQWSFGGSMLLLFAFILVLAVSGYVLPFYLREILRLDAGTAGLALAPYSVTICVAAPITGWIAARGGSGWLIVSGFALASLVAGFYGLALDNAPSWIAVAAGQALLGLAGGLFFSPNRVVSLSSVPLSDLGSANASAHTVRACGYAVGTAGAALVLQAAVPAGGQAIDPVRFLPVQGAIYLVIAGLLVLGTLVGLGRLMKARRPVTSAS